jgi:energy-coupling factor transporter ATP-binding protein EcfA2
MFRSLEVSKWRQFDRVSIEFHAKLTVLTGSNGAGKTTLLHLLAQHYDWSIPLTTGKRLSKKSLKKYLSDWYNAEADQDVRRPGHIEIGNFTYSDAKVSKIHIPREVDRTYSPHYSPPVRLQGIHIPSHRPMDSSRPVTAIPTVPQTRQQAYQRYFKAIFNRYRDQWDSKQSSPSFLMKENLVALAALGFGNQAVESNDDAIKTYVGFEEILRKVLPPTLGFKNLQIQLPDVILVTKSGEFSIDAASGGIRAILDLAWQLFMFSTGTSPFVVTLDEPENHLHPAMQQNLLPQFINAFPEAQFIVATHSPFIVGAVKESNVYVLKYNQEGRVETELLTAMRRAGTADEILRDVLGLPFTLPIWVDQKLQSIRERYLKTNIDSEKLGQLRRELAELGLGDLAAETIARVVREGDAR